MVLFSPPGTEDSICLLCFFFYIDQETVGSGEGRGGVENNEGNEI